MNKKTNIIIVLNCLIPLLIGTVIYYFFSSDVIFVKHIDEIIRCRVRFDSMLEGNWILRFVRFYVLDMLWAYALVFALHFLIGNNTANLKKVFLIAFAFSTTMEILQLTSLAEGTFDYLDIFFEFLAEVLAVFIIKNTLEEVLK